MSGPLDRLLLRNLQGASSLHPRAASWFESMAPSFAPGPWERTFEVVNKSDGSGSLKEPHLDRWIGSHDDARSRPLPSAAGELRDPEGVAAPRDGERPNGKPSPTPSAMPREEHALPVPFPISYLHLAGPLAVVPEPQEGNRDSRDSPDETDPRPPAPRDLNVPDATLQRGATPSLPFIPNRVSAVPASLEATRGRERPEKPVAIRKPERNLFPAWTARQSAPEPSIQVTIGRIEIRAERERSSARKSETAPSPVMGLQEYLRRQNKRSQQ